MEHKFVCHAYLTRFLAGQCLQFGELTLGATFGSHAEHSQKQKSARGVVGLTQAKHSVPRLCIARIRRSMPCCPGKVVGVSVAAPQLAQGRCWWGGRWEQPRIGTHELVYWRGLVLQCMCEDRNAHAHIASVMAQQVAGYAYWINKLVEHSGIPVRSELPRAQRRLFRELARLLLANDLDDVCQLGCCPDPSAWMGAESFSNQDLDILREIAKGQERWFLLTVCFLRGCCHVFMFDRLAARKGTVSQSHADGQIRSGLRGGSRGRVRLAL